MLITRIWISEFHVFKMKNDDLFTSEKNNDKLNGNYLQMVYWEYTWNAISKYWYTALYRTE